MAEHHGFGDVQIAPLAPPSCPSGLIYDESSHVCQDPSKTDRIYGDVKDSAFMFATLIAPPVIVGHRVYRNNGIVAAGISSVAAAFVTAAVFGFSMWVFTPGMFAPLAGSLAYSYFARKN